MDRRLSFAEDWTFQYNFSESWTSWALEKKNSMPLNTWWDIYTGCWNSYEGKDHYVFWKCSLIKEAWSVMPQEFRRNHWRETVWLDVNVNFWMKQNPGVCQKEWDSLPCFCHENFLLALSQNIWASYMFTNLFLVLLALSVRQKSLY